MKMAEGDGGIMQKILSITSPPNNTASSKQRRSKQPKPPQQPPNTRHTYIDNRSYCEACGDGGDLLCCERCPSSFHFGCCDPPLDPLHLPEGEWVCQGCRPSPAHLDEHSNKLFKPLLMQCCSENPLVFCLPEELMSIVAWKDVKHDKKSKQDSAVKFCYFCDKSSRHGRIISCDFCPLSYHMDCLTPPLTDRPISSTWMCPNHVEHRISDLQDVRLTKRKEALEKCRADVSRHSIKMDFFSTLNRIPGYHRNSSRSNRRTSEVPVAIKAMYATPLNDSSTTSSLTELLMTASEELELLRREMREEREGVGRGNCTVATGNCDEWTRHAVLSQATPTSDHTHRSTLDDLKDILSTSDRGNEATPICNGINEPMETLNQTKPPKHINGLVTPHNTIGLVPNVDSLSPGVIKLLAQQRIHQLFTDSSDAMMSRDSHVTKHFNRHSNRQASGGTHPLAILCPLSTYGPAHCMYKRIVTIGSSCNMDICLKDYGHCNFVSTHHACLILDKDSSEHELINYSEHGSIIDGVLYSCDFSDKLSNDHAPSLLLDDITARGTGSRGERARMRLEQARRSLLEKSQVNKAISAAYKLSKSVVRDYTPDPEAIAAAGIKRKRSLEPSECTGPPDESLPLDGSSIVSIPLSKTKKSSNYSNDRHHNKDKKPPTVNPSPSETSDGGADYRPCMCKRSASSLIGTGGKGWEGAASVYHGSKLRFGCIQLVVSVSDKPGFNELQHTLMQHKLL